MDASTERYESLITSEHNQQPKFMATVKNLVQPLANLYDLLMTAYADYDVDWAVGKQLDVVGEWVGVTRFVPFVLVLDYFGFDEGFAYMKTFGEEGLPYIGARFMEEGEQYSGVSTLEDPEYRLLLKAKIVKNQSRGTYSDVLQALAFLFNIGCSITDNGDMTFNIYIGRPLSTTENSLITNLDILPRPAGVRIGSVTTA